MQRIPLLFLLAAPAMASTAAEQSAGGEGQAGIDTILVTATRIEQTTAETGSTVRIIDAEEIAALGFSHALDAIAKAPGVTVNQNGAFGGSATVRIRGASSGQTLVLIDGVSVNDAVLARRRLRLRPARYREHRTHRDPERPTVDALGHGRHRRRRFHYHQTAGRRPRRQPVRAGGVVRRLSRRGFGRPWRRRRRLPARRHPVEHRRHFPGR